jgi:hypothetical protein
MRRLLSGLLFSVFLMTPVALQAEQRYYDRDYKDRHEWNEAERRAYRHWLEEERHMKYHNWNKARERERREYWRWRHQNPNWDRH